MKNTTRTLLLASTALLIAQGASAADTSNWTDAHHWQLRGRIIDVAPSESSSGSIAGSASVKNRVVPELDISYFFNDNVSAELILATSKHSV